MREARRNMDVTLVERSDYRGRSEMLSPAQARRYDLMVAAVEAGVTVCGLAIEQNLPAPSWWNELAPLNARERRGVKNEVVQRVRGAQA